MNIEWSKDGEKIYCLRRNQSKTRESTQLFLSENTFTVTQLTAVQYGLTNKTFILSHTNGMDGNICWSTTLIHLYCNKSEVESYRLLLLHHQQVKALNYSVTYLNIYHMNWQNLWCGHFCYPTDFSFSITFRLPLFIFNIRPVNYWMDCHKIWWSSNVSSNTTIRSTC